MKYIVIDRKAPLKIVREITDTNEKLDVYVRALSRASTNPENSRVPSYVSFENFVFLEVLVLQDEPETRSVVILKNLVEKYTMEFPDDDSALLFRELR